MRICGNVCLAYLHHMVGSTGRAKQQRVEWHSLDCIRSRNILRCNHAPALHLHYISNIFRLGSSVTHKYVFQRIRVLFFTWTKNGKMLCFIYILLLAFGLFNKALFGAYAASQWSFSHCCEFFFLAALLILNISNKCFFFINIL